MKHYHYRLADSENCLFEKLGLLVQNDGLQFVHQRQGRFVDVLITPRHQIRSRIVASTWP